MEKDWKVGDTLVGCSLIWCGSLSAKEHWRNFSPIETELAGFLAAFRVLDFYLRGTKVTIVTDHSPLKQVFSQQLHELSQRLFRMRTLLLEYNISVMVVRGKDHLMADALGRFVRGAPITSYDPLSEISKSPQGIHFGGFEIEENCCFSKGT